MSISVKAPLDHVEDANGLPYVGAKRYVYNQGTTTLRACFTDAALTIPAGNPLLSDAAGNFARVFTAPGTYKLRFETSAGLLIYEIDDIDSGLSAGSGALPIANGGTGATTAAAAVANLGAASASDVTALAAQISGFTASLTNLISSPQGRLTLTQQTPVLLTGVAAATAVYYTPYIGGLCPVWDGVQFNPKVFAELTLTLNANHLANTHYDCFIINDAGTIRIVTGPGWSNSAAGTSTRGSGAGTTELTRLNGIWVNANAMATARNGATTYNVLVNQGTYVGSIFIDASAGQVTCHTAYGQSRKWSLFNAYNRKLITLNAGDATTSWPIGGAGSFRAQNGASANSLTTFAGLVEEAVDIRLTQNAAITANQGAGATTGSLQIGIGYNSTTVASSTVGRLAITYGNMPAAMTHFIQDSLRAGYVAPPALGINVVTALEQATNSLTQTLYGGDDDMTLVAQWLG